MMHFINFLVFPKINPSDMNEQTNQPRKLLANWFACAFRSKNIVIKPMMMIAINGYARTETLNGALQSRVT